MIVEDINSGHSPMATVNFSVPDAIRDDFNRVFRGQNKSAILAGLMRRAVQEAELRERREKLFADLTKARARRPTARARVVSTARRAGRP